MEPQVEAHHAGYIVHPEDVLWLLFGRLERPCAHHVMSGADWLNGFSRLRLQPSAFKELLERRYEMVMRGDMTATIPPALTSPLPPREQAHVNEIIQALGQLPPDVWMCTVCSCPTAQCYGAGRYYCCYACGKHATPRPDMWHV